MAATVLRELFTGHDRAGVPAVTTTVDWWPLTFRLAAAQEEVIRWFRHHLCSVAAGDTAGGPRRLIRLTALVDAALAGTLHRRLRDRPVRHLAGYLGESWQAGTVDGYDVRCCGPSPDSGRGGRLVVVGRPGEHLVIGADARDVAAGSVRVARELLRMELAGRGALTLHASLATARGRGVLFVGDSGAGKTTLAVTLARSGGYLVSVDQTEVLRDGGTTPYGVGFPWPARLGVGMLAGMGLDRAVESMPLLRTQRPLRQGRMTAESRTFRSVEKIELSMLELDSVLGVLALDRAPIDAVVLARVAPAGAPLRVTRTTLAEAGAEMARELREPDPVFPTFWMAPAGQPPPAPGAFADLCTSLGDVPLLRLHWRADEHPAATALEHIGALLDQKVDA